MNIRRITKTSPEYADLRDLWIRTFGDSPEDVDSIYDNLHAEGYIIEESGQLQSCLTVFDAGMLADKSVQVVYAVCTQSESRGQGYASKLLSYTREQIEESGSIALTCPAEESLEQFYKNLGFSHCDYAHKFEAPATDDLEISVEAIDHIKYAELRESFLANIPHVTVNDSLLRQVQSFSVNGNGMLLINRGDAICIVDYGTEDEMYVSELLIHPLLLERSEEIVQEIASALAKMFETEKCIYRTTCSDDTIYYGLAMK